MRLTLAQRIWGWSSSITLAALLGFFLIADRSFRSIIRAGVEANVRSGAALAAQVRAAQLDALIGSTADFAQDPVLKGSVDTRDPATIAQVLSEERRFSGVDWLAVLSVEGDALASTPGAPLETLADAQMLLRDARHYDTGDVWVRDGAVLDVAASPILFGTLPMGILVAGRRVDRAALGDIETYARQRVALLAHGRVLVGDAPGGADAGPLALISPGGLVQEFRVGGEDFFATQSPVVDASGEPVASLLVYESFDAALAPARTLRASLVGLVLLALAVAFLLALVLARRITGPVSRLLEDIHKLGEGNLEHPVRPVRQDEIGRLAEGFEQMRVSLKDAQTELIRSERLSAVGQMASSIVHDFSNPLAAIRMNAQLLEYDAGGPSTEARDIVGLVDRMNAMMAEVLEFARGDVSLDERRVTVPGWLAEVERFWTPLANSTKVRFEVRCVYGGCWVFDPERMRRAVDNLVRNALAPSTRAESVRVHASTAGDHLRLQVVDDGQGIPIELHESLFQPFTTAGKKNGTGLGLAICKNVVERHGGSIDFASSPMGTTFTIDLPRGKSECVDAA